MANPLRSPQPAGHRRRPPAIVDSALVELVDALVGAIDIARSWEVDRLRGALELFGTSGLLDVELRLKGRPSTNEGCICEDLL